MAGDFESSGARISHTQLQTRAGAKFSNLPREVKNMIVSNVGTSISHLNIEKLLVSKDFKLSADPVFYQSIHLEFFLQLTEIAEAKSHVFHCMQRYCEDLTIDLDGIVMAFRDGPRGPQDIIMVKQRVNSWLIAANEIFGQSNARSRLKKLTIALIDSRSNIIDDWNQHLRALLANPHVKDLSLNIGGITATTSGEGTMDDWPLSRVFHPCEMIREVLPRLESLDYCASTICPCLFRHGSQDQQPALPNLKKMRLSTVLGREGNMHDRRSSKLCGELYKGSDAASLYGPSLYSDIRQSVGFVQAMDFEVLALLQRMTDPVVVRFETHQRSRPTSSKEAPKIEVFDAIKIVYTLRDRLRG